MIKKIIIAIVALIILLIVAVGIFLATFDLNHYRGYIQQRISLMLNKPVQIGVMRSKLSLSPTIEISNLRILEDDTNHKAVLEIPTANVSLELIPLIRDFNFDIKKIDTKLISVDLDSFSPKQNHPQKNGSISNNTQKKLLDSFWIKDIVADKILLRFTHEGKRQAIELTKFTIKELNNFKFQLGYNKKSFEIEGSFGSLKKFLSTPTSVSFNLKVKQGNASATLKGQIGDLKNFKKIRLNTSFEVLKLSTFLKNWQISTPAIMDVGATLKFQTEGDLEKMWINNLELNLAKSSLVVSGSGEAIKLKKSPRILLKSDIKFNESSTSKTLNLKPFELKSDLTLSTSALNIEHIDFRTGHSDFSGNIEISWKDKIKINPNLKSSYFDLKDLLLNTSPSKVEVSTKKKSAYNKKNKTNWSLLNEIEMSGKIFIEHLFITNLITDYVTVELLPTIQNNNLSTKFKGKFLEGSINGTINLNAINQTADIKLNGNNLNLDKIRYIYTKIRNIRANTHLSITTQGNTSEELLSSLNGRLDVEFIGGTIVDSWFNSLPIILNSAKKNTDGLDFSTTDKKTKILCGVINVPIENGLITSNENIVLQTEFLDFAITGEINLKRKNMDIALVPTVAKTNTNNFLSLAQLIHISGPWDKPAFELDTKKFLMNLIQSKKIAQNTYNTPNSKFYLCQKALGSTLEKPSQKPTQKKERRIIPSQAPQKEDLRGLFGKILSDK